MTAPKPYELRADYDTKTITVYQAYSPQIATAALEHGRFVAPFSFNRMTWIKPSFLWLMARSNWGARPGQERTLAVRITRTGWERALALAVPTDPQAPGYGSYDRWRVAFDRAAVHVQWDTERSLHGAGLPYYSIQVGLSRHVIREFVDEWITEIVDLTERVRKMRDFLNSRQVDKARRLLPREAVYPLSPELRRRICASE
ncbi:DUF4291 domain-containing protein [Polyangium mundeleinium]|uniref:DUF4291 domain-containing protein n=1 Tax=Polyangium mundeleinium TaxID=2995306 RepID=A0ABT5EHI6_9BACT|nr:DUF4291 domain-containing protein [Polyangium mundeleinium]MDC0740842.1 DUF4291 domain-containing protein [Polyangium mundeleinium]